ncbi:MAG: lactate racemase domain-containing protein [Anaerolineae bacterium]|nr:lactate racemase domain-containing protein [Anaerolineae bacterium]
METVIGQGYVDRALTQAEVRALVAQVFEAHPAAGKRVLIIVPDGTRSAPLGLMFRAFYEAIGTQVASLEYLIALGTHRPMDETQINALFGLTPEERADTYAAVRISNHEWYRPESLIHLGTLPSSEIECLTGGLLRTEVPVTVNRKLLACDQIVICGPTFPHEVVGFSGGNKYFFPGVSGPEMINFTHWLGALITTREIIGIRSTPVRQVIDRAASLINTPKLCFSMVVRGKDELVGLYCGTPEAAFEAAAQLSARHHIIYVERPFRRVLSVMPEMYDDLWTAAKGMYKVEPVVEDGGEVIIYAPHITEVSYTHGALLDAIGYHVRDYFLHQWERFAHYPWCVLAHSTHLRGSGSYDATTGVERPRIQVTLATGIPRERCERLGLGYLDPSAVNPEAWAGLEDEGILLVPRAGEMLYRLAS